MAPRRSRPATAAAIPRFGRIFDAPAPPSRRPPPVQSCALVSDRPDLATALTAALEAAYRLHRVRSAHGFDGAAESLQAAVDGAGPIDAVVVALEGHPRTSSTLEGWEHVLADHRGILEPLHDDASWVRAAADYAGGADRPVRLVILTDATTPAGRSRAQSSAQLARVAAAGTKGRVTAFTAGLEASGTCRHHAAGELAAHLLGHPDAAPLAGAELVVARRVARSTQPPAPDRHRDLRRTGHPAWLDNSLREIVAATDPRLEGGLMATQTQPHRRRPRPPVGPRQHELVPLPLHGTVRTAAPATRRG